VVEVKTPGIVVDRRLMAIQASTSQKFFWRFQFRKNLKRIIKEIETGVGVLFAECIPTFVCLLSSSKVAQ
jgi:hypothetical protein